jgi:hypothetical protein
MTPRIGTIAARTLLGASLTLAAPLIAAAQTAPPPVKLGIVSFLSGPAAAPFGIPGRNGAELLIEALNAGTAPAPYNTVGLGGAKIEAKYVDEAGSTAQVVTQFRNLVQRDQVDAVVGYVSSGKLPCGHAGRRGTQGSSRSSITIAARRASSRKSRANTCSGRQPDRDHG